jgi:hypothetical protein
MVLTLFLKAMILDDNVLEEDDYKTIALSLLGWPTKLDDNRWWMNERNGRQEFQRREVQREGVFLRGKVS